MDLQELAVRLKVTSYKYNITPTHMAMAMFVLADVMEYLPSTPTMDTLAQESGLSNANEISTMYRMIAKEIMR